MPELPAEEPDDFAAMGITINIANPFKDAEYDSSHALWEDNETKVGGSWDGRVFRRMLVLKGV